MAGSGRRFALEAVFLVALAVGAGLAGLSAGQIIGVMALGWLLTALVELASWLLAVRHPAGVVARSEAAAVPETPEAAVEPEPERADVREPRPPVDQPVVAEALQESAPVAQHDEEPVAVEQPLTASPEPDDEQPESESEVQEEPAEAPRAALEPLQPRPKRRPFWRRRREEEREEVDVASLERPSAHHVRLLPRPPGEPDEADTDEDALGGPPGRVDAEQR